MANGIRRDRARDDEARREADLAPVCRDPRYEELINDARQKAERNASETESAAG